MFIYLYAQYYYAVMRDKTNMRFIYNLNNNGTDIENFNPCLIFGVCGSDHKIGIHIGDTISVEEQLKSAYEQCAEWQELIEFDDFADKFEKHISLLRYLVIEYLKATTAEEKNSVILRAWNYGFSAYEFGFRDGT